MSDPLLLVGVGIWCFVVAFAGGLVGLVLGNIRLPVLLLAAGNPAAGAGANIAVSGIAAATASIAHVRAGRVDWRLVGLMLPPSMLGAAVGAALAGEVPGRLLLVLIGLTLLWFAVGLLRPRAAVATSATVDAAQGRRSAVVGGALIGLLGGFVGLILGSLRLPLLLGRVGRPLREAIGTNAVVGVGVGAAGLVGHLPTGVDWRLLGVGAVASVPGALLGSRLTGRLAEATLRRAVGWILLVTGAAVLVDAAAG